MSAAGLLLWITRTLDAAGIAHMVVGSFASSAHGLPRMTHDLDVVIDPTAAQLSAFLITIDLDRYYVDLDVAREALRRRSMFNIIDSHSGWKLDLIIRKSDPHARAELERRVTTTILGVATAIATAEDVIIAKLTWSRDSGSVRQLDDVRGILQIRGDDLDRAYLDHWLDELALRDQWDRIVAEMLVVG